MFSICPSSYARNRQVSPKVEHETNHISPAPISIAGSHVQVHSRLAPSNLPANPQLTGGRHVLFICKMQPPSQQWSKSSQHKGVVFISVKLTGKLKIYFTKAISISTFFFFLNHNLNKTSFMFAEHRIMTACLWVTCSLKTLAQYMSF